MADHVPAILTSHLASLNPFGKHRNGVDAEELGGTINATSVAGGGHSARPTTLTKEQLRVSEALKSFLMREQVLPEADLNSEQITPALKELLDQPHVEVPAEILDRSYPLPEYFVSSSHNTYLLAHQLYGQSSPSAYTTALRNGARCVEIDAWDPEEDKDEPKVTHGYTLASNISFRAACIAIRDVVDEEAKSSSHGRAAPILVSLENHCSAHGQLRLAQIMREVWGDRLLSKHIRNKGHHEQDDQGEHVKLEELGAKIAVIVEYHLGEELEESSSSDSDDDDGEQSKAELKAYRAKKATEEGAGIIIPELAELGVYAQSVKPVNKSWLEGELTDPHHHLINMSESAVAALMPASTHKIATHNSQHLMRVFPKGTRISSRNMHPSIYWGVGAQICALNWQTFDSSMQLNEALFSGSDGYVLKPAALRSGGSGKLSTGQRKKLRLHIAGATDVPVPEGHKAEDMRPYLTCTLIHPDDIEHKHPKRKTHAYKQHKLALVHKDATSPATDPLWDEVLEWDFEENELVFLRLIIKSDDKFAKNPMFAVSAVRLSYVVDGWTFVRMLDLKGRETHCTLLVKFDVEDV